ncbi:hypothetical protein NL676_008089 [Syzygium grande]|nr:hypothetical protein NL676_008089 [Syzygium grande]
MTHREDHFDEALLRWSLFSLFWFFIIKSFRPGRLEVQDETSLPDENGYLQIFQIQTNKLKENSSLAPDVSLQELAARTKNYSGAEIEGVVKSAVSYALNRQLRFDDLTKHVDEESIKVTMNDFLNAIQEIVPGFGVSRDELERYRMYMVEEDKGTRHTDSRDIDDEKKVLEQLNVFSEDDVNAAAEALNEMPIKKLSHLVEMAAQGEHGGAAEAIYSSREKIKIAHFYNCLQDFVRCKRCGSPP